MIEGGCCCGAVRFSVSEKPTFAAACHCSRCRKVGMTPFAIVKAEQVEILSGRESLVDYVPEQGFEHLRCFCGRCGTSMGEMTSDEAMYPIPLDCFDDDLGLELRFHEHVATKPSWAVIPEGVKQFEGDPS